MNIRAECCRNKPLEPVHSSFLLSFIYEEKKSIFFLSVWVLKQQASGRHSDDHEEASSPPLLPPLPCLQWLITLKITFCKIARHKIIWNSAATAKRLKLSLSQPRPGHPSQVSPQSFIIISFPPRTVNQIIKSSWSQTRFNESKPMLHLKAWWKPVAALLLSICI